MLTARCVCGYFLRAHARIMIDVHSRERSSHHTHASNITTTTTTLEARRWGRVGLLVIHAHDEAKHTTHTDTQTQIHQHQHQQKQRQQQQQHVYDDVSS